MELRETAQLHVAKSLAELGKGPLLTALADHTFAVDLTEAPSYQLSCLAQAAAKLRLRAPGLLSAAADATKRRAEAMALTTQEEKKKPLGLSKEGGGKDKKKAPPPRCTVEGVMIKGLQGEMKVGEASDMSRCRLLLQAKKKDKDKKKKGDKKKKDKKSDIKLMATDESAFGVTLSVTFQIIIIVTITIITIISIMVSSRMMTFTNMLSSKGPEKHAESTYRKSKKDKKKKKKSSSDSSSSDNKKAKKERKRKQEEDNAKNAWLATKMRELRKADANLTARDAMKMAEAEYEKIFSGGGGSGGGEVFSLRLGCRCCPNPKAASVAHSAEARKQGKSEEEIAKAAREAGERVIQVAEEAPFRLPASSSSMASFCYLLLLQHITVLSITMMSA
ncbi:hypothetical protein AK812_SmicGene1852 [Symbiodinium microadriaticum]|uniref:Uncharacterized protein n=1 Tax=Symbiodinium microadriaticum TaxID=2951 RepID=A0A1Q9F372_SYMMI|nr:hypothetical protein AK812_SmicGene1852 [Symbiodinium microadriaticum]